MLPFITVTKHSAHLVFELEAPQLSRLIVLSPGNSFELAAFTSHQPMADTQGEVRVSFLVDHYWTRPQSFFKQVLAQSSVRGTQPFVFRLLLAR